MSDETADGSAGASDDGRRGGNRLGEQSPLRSGAAFFANWDWQSIADLNQRLCERGGAQFGFNSESGAAAGREWEGRRCEIVELIEALDSLRSYHRRASFLFFNGNTFADIARVLGGVLFRELPGHRLKVVTSALAHDVAGVMDREPMIDLVEALCLEVGFEVGDRVQTLRGSVRGVVLALLDGDRIRWRTDDGLEMTGAASSLVKEE